MELLIFNHHSLPFDHRSEAEASVPDFLKMCIAARNAGLRTILVDESVDPSWFSVQLAENYFWRDWHDRAQADSNRDQIRAFRSIATQSPFFKAADIAQDVELFEVFLNSQANLSAVRAAAWHEAPLASFNTGKPWNEIRLRIQTHRLIPDSEEIEEEDVELLNFFSHAVFQKLLPEITAIRNEALSTGRAIVEQFGDHYPGVYLCGKANQQLNHWSASQTILDQIKNSLTVLSQFAHKWKSGAVHSYSSDALKNSGLMYRVSPESPTVRNHPGLRSEREFWLPNGRQEFFEQHIKLASGFRLHFYPDQKTKDIYVGYIGPHLRLK